MSSILVIDDDPVIRTYLTRLLSKDHRIDAFASCSEAFQALSENVYELVLLDVEMPGFQGDDIARMIRNRDHGKVVLFSSLSVEDLEAKSKACHADGYIAKSSNPQELMKSLRHFL